MVIRNVACLLLWLIRWALLYVFVLGLAAAPGLLWWWADPHGFKMLPVVIVFGLLYGFGGYVMTKSKRVENFLGWLEPGGWLEPRSGDDEREWWDWHGE